MKVTLQTIADAADASVSTVSRALSGHPAISAQTVERVVEIARNLKYPLRDRLPLVADPDRSLADKTIAIVSLGMDRSLLSLPAVSLAINGAEAELSRRGARVMLSHVPDLTKSLQFKTDDLAGIIVAGSSQGTLISDSGGDLIERLCKLPTVWLVGRPDGCWGDAVGSNDFLTGQLAANYLFERGHRRLAFLSPKPDHLVFVRRGAGFLSRASSLGADVVSITRAPAEGWMLPDRAALTTDAVEPLVHDLLALSPRPTAVFAAADSVAAAMYRALAAQGIRLGADLSLISANNDESLTAGLYPRLTTFDIHAEQIGRQAAAQLGRRLAEPDTLPAMELLLMPTLVERNSVTLID